MCMFDENSKFTSKGQSILDFQIRIRSKKKLTKDSMKKISIIAYNLYVYFLYEGKP
jgi:hypothetical protein